MEKWEFTHIVSGEPSPEHLSETADFIVRIPMRGGCDSINVSVAAGVLLFEMSGRRRGS